LLGGWAGHVARMRNIGNTYKMVIRKVEGMGAVDNKMDI
jgi:hypothetical protein